MLTVHDLIPLKYPADYPGFRNHLVRLLTPGSLRRADLILSPTQSVCDDIARRFPSLRAPRRPFFSGVDPARFAQRAGTPAAELSQRFAITGPFIFSPGAIESRKNLEVVISAMARHDDAVRADLLLAGPIRDRRYLARVMEFAAELGVARHVRHLGFVSEADLVGLYGLAAICVAASRDEGFNLLPIEAMACGTPVLCSDIPVHRELFDGGALFFPLDDSEFLAHELRRVLTTNMDRQAVSQGAETCIKRLSWEAMAARMAGFFDELDVLPLET